MDKTPVSFEDLEAFFKQSGTLMCQVVDKSGTSYLAPVISVTPDVNESGMPGKKLVLDGTRAFRMEGSSFVWITIHPDALPYGSVFVATTSDVFMADLPHNPYFVDTSEVSYLFYRI